MKKFLVCLFTAAFLLMVSMPVYAGIVERQIIDTTLDDSPTSITGSWNTSEFNHIAIVTVYDETEVGNSISATVTVDVSRDGSTWLDAYFSDVAGTTTAQTSETLSSDGSYILWLDSTIIYPYVRLSIEGVNTDSDDTLEVDGYLIGRD